MEDKKARFEKDLEGVCSSFNILPNDDERAILYDIFLAGWIAGMDACIDITTNNARTHKV